MKQPTKPIPAEHKEATHTIEIIRGVEGLAVYLNNLRIAGPKPWGGGTSLSLHRVPEKFLTQAIRARAQAERESDLKREG